MFFKWIQFSWVFHCWVKRWSLQGEKHPSNSCLFGWFNIHLKTYSYKTQETSRLKQSQCGPRHKSTTRLKIDISRLTHVDQKCCITWDILSKHKLWKNFKSPLWFTISDFMDHRLHMKVAEQSLWSVWCLFVSSDSLEKSEPPLSPTQLPAAARRQAAEDRAGGGAPWKLNIPIINLRPR